MAQHARILTRPDGAAEPTERVDHAPKHRRQLAITGIDITPVAFADPPLLNAVGVHEPWALRAIVRMRTDAGITGLGETYGDAGHLHRLREAAGGLIGADPFHLNDLRARVTAAMVEDTVIGGHGMSGMVTGSATADRVYSPFEVAALDIQGHALGLPVATLLGGAVREAVPFSGYLFYKWAGHPDERGVEAEDDWGAALDEDGLVRQARRMVDDYGFGALKLKAGVLEPDREATAIEALRAEFPDLPLRIDPNAAWTVETSVRIGRRLAGVLEYLEDPTPGIAGMAEVRRRIDLPLATNMCLVAFADLPPAVAAGAVDVVLSDHHFWGGLRRSQLLGGIAQTWGLGLSMHSNSHLGISLAAMVHLAAATPNVDYACDTHWPWKTADDDVLVPGQLVFRDGAVRVPTGPGLGVIVDEDALDRLHRQYLDCGLRSRDDTGYRQRVNPGFTAMSPRW